MPKMVASQDLQMSSFLRRWSVSTEAVTGTHLPGLFCPDWSPVWLIPVRVTPSAAFFFSLRLRVRFRSADHSWARGHRKQTGGSYLGNHSGPKHLLSQPYPSRAIATFSLVGTALPFPANLKLPLRPKGYDGWHPNNYRALA